MDRTTRQRINNEIEDFNNTIKQLILTDKYKTPHSTTADKSFFSSAHATFSGIDHISGLKKNIKNLKYYYPSKYLLHNGIKVEINKED